MHVVRTHLFLGVNIDEKSKILAHERRQKELHDTTRVDEILK